MIGKNNSVNLIILILLIITFILSFIILNYILLPNYNIYDNSKIVFLCPNGTLITYENSEIFDKQLYICGEFKQVSLEEYEDRFINNEIEKYINGIK